MFPSNLINYVAQRFSSEQGCDQTNLATRQENKQPNLPLIKDLISKKLYHRDQILRNRHLFSDAEAVPRNKFSHETLLSRTTLKSKFLLGALTSIGN